MTGAIFYTVFLAIYGFIIGKSFKGLNPFLMFLGMVFSLPIFIQADRYQENIIFIPFALGFLWNFTNPIRRVMDFFSDIKYNIQESLRRNRYEKQQQQNYQRTAYHQQDTDDLYRQKEQIEAELRQNQQKAQEDLYEQEREAQQRIKQAAEELKRRQEQFRREQASANTQNSSSTSTSDLNPDNFNDACEILGCKPTDDLTTIKRAYRVLRAMYHPDKVEQFGGRRKEQAELEMQLINRAWRRVKREF